MKKIVLLLLALLLAFTLFSCAEKEVGETPDDPQNEGAANDTETAENVPFPDAVDFTVKVIFEDGSSQELSVHSDAASLGDALLSNAIADGEEGQYGLYVTSVMGVEAKDGAFWSFEKNGKTLTKGVDETPIEAGDVFTVTYTK